MSKLEKFLEWFHDGREDEYNRILKVFGTTRNFLKTVLKNNEQNQVDITYIPSSEFQNDSELFNFIVDNGFLDDVDYNNLEDVLKNYYLISLIEKDTSNGLKFICDKGGAQNRTTHLVYHFIKCQLEHLLIYKIINKYFMNILDGDTCFKYISKFNYLKNNKKYKDVIKYIFIGDMNTFQKYWINQLIITLN